MLLLSSTLVLHLSSMGNASLDRSMVYLILPLKDLSNDRFLRTNLDIFDLLKYVPSQDHTCLTQPLLFITSPILILSGDVELNPGPPNDEIKWVCSSTEEAGHMLACEYCSCWNHSECVNISPSIADKYPFICPFCLQSAFSSVQSLCSDI